MLFHSQRCRTYWNDIARCSTSSRWACLVEARRSLVAFNSESKNLMRSQVSNLSPPNAKERDFDLLISTAPWMRRLPIPRMTIHRRPHITMTGKKTKLKMTQMDDIISNTCIYLSNHWWYVQMPGNNCYVFKRWSPPRWFATYRIMASFRLGWRSWPRGFQSPLVGGSVFYRGLPAWKPPIKLASCLGLPPPSVRQRKTWASHLQQGLSTHTHTRTQFPEPVQVVFDMPSAHLETKTSFWLQVLWMLCDNFVVFLANHRITTAFWKKKTQKIVNRVDSTVEGCFDVTVPNRQRPDFSKESHRTKPCRV